MQPDIQALTVRGLHLLDRLKMLSPEEAAVALPYAAALDDYLKTRTPPPPSNVVSLEDHRSARVVQRAEIRRLANRGYPSNRGVNEFGDDVYDDD